ncbi:MAG: bifunctional phosphoserine phosphatase/homoserine phosphotransferase ThrH [Pseudomonadota bacterium]
MHMLCLDLEGVLIPEIWVNFADATGLKELRATTRDIPVYDDLMKMRLKVLDREGLKLPDIQKVIATLEPLPGAIEFVAWAREHFQVVILSDTFYDFALPLIKKLGSPTLFCHRLEITKEGKIADYKIRQQDSKRHAVEAFHSLNYRTIAAGDSYNDISMLKTAHKGILFSPPQNVIDEFPQFPVTRTYAELQKEIEKFLN